MMLRAPQFFDPWVPNVNIRLLPRYVFNHPIDFHFIADSVANWPKLHLQIFKLDACGRIEPLGCMAL